MLVEKGFVLIHKVDANTLQLARASQRACVCAAHCAVSLNAYAWTADDAPERLANAGVKAVAAIAWRPMAKNFLAVAHAGGVSLWTTCGTAPSNIASGAYRTHSRILRDSPDAGCFVLTYFLARRHPRPCTPIRLEVHNTAVWKSEVVSDGER